MKCLLLTVGNGSGQSYWQTCSTGSSCKEGSLHWSICLDKDYQHQIQHVQAWIHHPQNQNQKPINKKKKH